jgi:hypothetical protein
VSVELNKLNAPILDADPAKAMYAPAIIPIKNNFVKEPLLFSTLDATDVFNISAGFK